MKRTGRACLLSLLMMTAKVATLRTSQLRDRGENRTPASGCNQEASGLVPLTPDPTKIGLLEGRGLLNLEDLRYELFEKLECVDAATNKTLQAAWFPQGDRDMGSFVLEQRRVTKRASSRQQKPPCTLNLATARPPPEGTLGELNGKQLFVDDHLVDSFKGLQRFLAAPIERGELLIPERMHNVTVRKRGMEYKPQRGFGFPGTVLHNGTHFLMYYRRYYGKARGARGKKNLGASASKNGLDWETLELDYDFPQSQRGMEQCVMFDPLMKNASHRFVMTYGCRSDFGCIATSPDGISWTDHGKKFGRWTDTQPCMYRDGASFVLQTREEFSSNGPTPNKRGWRGVKLMRIGEDDFTDALETGKGKFPWKMESAWHYDKRGLYEPLERQAYAFTTTLYEGVYLGLSLNYEWPLYTKCQETRWKEIGKKMEDKAPGDIAIDTVFPYLATSRDGVHYNFDWAYARQPLPLGMNMNSSFRYVDPASQFVTFGGYHWLYYTGNTESHVRRFRGEDKVYLAQWEQDRLSGLRPDGGREGHVQTKAFRWPSNAFVLMVNLKLRGEASSCEVRVTNHESDDNSVIADSCESAACIDMKAWIPHNRSQEMSLSFHISGEVELYGFAIQRYCH